MLELETRSFETRFGDRCPFCNKSWNDRNPCGDSRADWTMRDGLRLLFADRTDNCVVCDRQVQQGRKYCFDCGLSVERARNRGDRHATVKAECVACRGPFEVRSDKRGQRFCSISCAQRKQFCHRGHDKDAVGRTTKGQCRECARANQRKAAA